VYDEKLGARVRRLLSDQAFVEKRMFGGLCFMVGGRMCCGVVNDDLVLRVGPDAYAHALSLPHARPMDFTGRPLRGFVYVGPKGRRTDRQLRSWVARALAYVATLQNPKWRGSANRKPRSGFGTSPPISHSHTKKP
jgi:TfoX/Sxy family transcriptional regulator of competence genes